MRLLSVVEGADAILYCTVSFPSSQSTYLVSYLHSGTPYLYFQFFKPASQKSKEEAPCRQSSSNHSLRLIRPCSTLPLCCRNRLNSKRVTTSFPPPPPPPYPNIIVVLSFFLPSFILPSCSRVSFSFAFGLFLSSDS